MVDAPLPLQRIDAGCHAGLNNRSPITMLDQFSSKSSSEGLYLELNIHLAGGFELESMKFERC